jgi:hypothetical protein
MIEGEALMEKLIKTKSPEIYLLVSGEVAIRSSTGEIRLMTGEPAAFVIPGTDLHILFLKPGLLFRAKVPIHNR